MNDDYGWIKCLVCNGSGRVFDSSPESEEVCDVCKGRGMVRSPDGKQRVGDHTPLPSPRVIKPEGTP